MTYNYDQRCIEIIAKSTIDRMQDIVACREIPAAAIRKAPQRPSLYDKIGGRKYLNESEWRRALAAFKGLSIERALLCQLLAYAGARVSEILAVTANSFSVEQCTVSIITLKRRAYVVREIPIPPWLMRAMDKAFGLRKRQSSMDFANQRIWTICRCTAWRILKSVFTPLGIIGRRASCRGLRHSYATISLGRKIPIHLISRWLGHARLSTTAIYMNVIGPEEFAFARLLWQSKPPPRRAAYFVPGDEIRLCA